MNAPGAKRPQPSRDPGRPKPRRAPAPRSSGSGGSRLAARIGILMLATLVTIGLAALYPVTTELDALLSARWERWIFLFALVLVPLLFWRGTFGEDRRTPRLRLGTLSPLQKGPIGWRVWVRDVPGVLRSVALGLFVLALARPVSMTTPDTSEEQGIDIVVVLDLSGSMRAVIDDLPDELKPHVGRLPKGSRPTRLDAAKAVIRDFVARREADRIGVVVFGKNAYVLSPPTLDYQLLDSLVAKMELRLIDGSATAIGDAVGVAVARLRRSHAESKAVILLTDGDNNAGRISPEYAAHLATVVGAKVYPIQIGDGELAQVQDGTDLFGNPRYVTVPFPVNPDLLQQIASKTGAEMFVATDAEALQASFHGVLDDLEKTRFEANIASFRDLYRLFLLPGVLLLALDALLRALVLRRFP